MYTLDSCGGLKISSANDTYIYDIKPVGSGIAVISSDDDLRLLDPQNFDVPPASHIKAVNKDVTCLETLASDSSPAVLTAGRDGRIVVWDPRMGSRTGEMKTDNSCPILALATSRDGYSIAAGTELVSHQVAVLIWDSRNMATVRLQYTESHSDDVTEMQYHPSLNHVLMSGSTDGLLNLYDTTITDEDDALYQTINHRASIHHAGFLTDVDIFALSDDQKFSTSKMIVNPDEDVEEPIPLEFGDLRERFGCEYVANVLPRPGGTGVVGVGSHSNDNFELIQLRNDEPWGFLSETKVALHGAHASEIVRTFCFLDQHQTILTGGEDGMIKAWRSA